MHNTFLVEDLATAIPHIGPYIDQRIRLVSLQGDAVDLCGRVAGGKSDRAEEASVLGQGREMAALRSVLAHGKSSLCAVNAQRHSAQQRTVVLQRRQKHLTQTSEQLREAEFDCRSQYNLAHTDVSRLDQQQRRLKGESQEFDGRLEQLHTGIADQEKQLGLLEEQGIQLEARLTQLEQDLEGIENQQRQKTEQLSAMRIERARIVEQTESLKRDTQRLQHYRKRTRAAISNGSKTRLPRPLPTVSA